VSREVRRVLGVWQHPLNEYGNYRPLFEPHAPFEEMLTEWQRNAELWANGAHPDQLDSEFSTDCTYEEWEGGPPEEQQYMPWWPEEERTHYQMYETTSEGTPISPVLATPEELAQWLVDHGASAFADQGATYEEWLHTIQHGSGGSCVLVGGQLISSVAYAARKDES
jgi:hypothetical protein